MRYIYQHIETIIRTYDGSLPLTHFLKNYFRQYPKLGSRDRKALSEMAYCWYRCSKGFDTHIAFDEKLQSCLQACNSSGKHIEPFLPKEDKNQRLHYEDLFPYSTQLSNGITKQEWLQSMLVQPDMFIRVRKNIKKIETTLHENEIPFRVIQENTLAIPNGKAIDKLLNPEDYVIQDASSQQTGTYFNPAKNEQWWDCCSGAGGKSLLLKDKEPSVHLTVSDTRASILHNLKERLKLYNIPVPTAHIVDAADAVQLRKALNEATFDGIICDVPCSGSGTWSRTPEHLYFFKEEKVHEFASLQETIAVNASQYLKQGGHMYYITCSVFVEENEHVVAKLAQRSGLKLLSQQIINGIDIKADSMFIAVLQKN